MNVTLWRKIVEGWLASYWAGHPDMDHAKFEIDLESIQAFANKMKANRNETIEVKDGEE